MRERGITRVRPLNSNVAALSEASATIAESMTLDLFPDVSFTVDLDHVEQQSGDNVAWFGRVRGARYGSATFVRSASGLIGSVTRGDGKIYQLRTAEDGSQWTVEIDQSKFPAREDISLVPALESSEKDPAALQSGLVASPDDGSTIDVMVLYTPAARQAAGGTTGMQQLVQLGIAETNLGYSNSGVTQRVRLVYSGETNYTESSSFNTDLNRLSTSNDAYLDDVPALRNTYGADIVSLWRSPGSDVCGIGWELPNVTSTAAVLAGVGFNVVSVDCATGYYSFGHEMGHNMGADHAKDDNAPNGPFLFGSGYKQTTGTSKWRTIMAYDASCSCPRINYWSNPNIQYNGLATGIDPNSGQSAANYLVLNNTRSIVANFRSAVSGATPPADTTGPSLSITSHTNNQTVSVSSITISGTATDSGKGDSGISSVTVNNVRAISDTATGTGTANWSSRTVTLTAGANTITVVAKDNSSALNSTTTTITITYTAPTTSTTSTTSATASTYHVFPQFADGRFSDGSYYRTTLMISNPSSSAGTACTIQLRGLTVPGFSLSYSIAAGGWVIAPTSGTQNFQSGYATLQCSSSVEAQLLYSYYSSRGVKISEATVFSSPPAATVKILADETEGAQVGLAITNDSDQSVTYTVTVTNAAGTGTVTLGPRSSTAKFLDQIVPGIPPNNVAQVAVSSSNGTASIIGLRYTGGVFTTLPASIRSTVGLTASTYHVFPQFADGKFADGSYYRTTQMFINPNSSGTANCTSRLRGLTTDGYNVFTASLSQGSAVISPTSGTQTFQSGYATLQCSASVDAQLLYSYYGSNGAKLSEATVFSSPSAQRLQILADEREGAQVGLAIANDSDQTVTYTISVTNATGTGTVTLGPRSSTAKFLSQFVSGIPANNVGQVMVSASSGTASIIGLRFTGTTFTTIPATIR